MLSVIVSKHKDTLLSVKSIFLFSYSSVQDGIGVSLLNAFEPVVVCLVGNLDHHLGEAEGLDDILALLELHVGALLHVVGLALGAGSSLAFGPVAGDLDLVEAGHGVVDGGQVSAGVGGHFDGVRYIDQLAVLPGDDLAVLVTGPHLLSQLVDDPLGLALLLLHGLADWLMVYLDQGLGVGLEAVLGDKAGLAARVVLHQLGEGYALAVGIRLGLALLDGDLDTGRSGLGLAAATHLVGAEVRGGGVVLDLAVAGDGHTVLLVTITVVIAARETGDKSDQEEQVKHDDNVWWERMS